MIKIKKTYCKVCGAGDVQLGCSWNNSRMLICRECYQIELDGLEKEIHDGQAYSREMRINKKLDSIEDKLKRVLKIKRCYYYDDSDCDDDDEWTPEKHEAYRKSEIEEWENKKIKTQEAIDEQTELDRKDYLNFFKGTKKEL